ncbi:MAG: hypothetical protein Q9227_004001 [Pyrenula ochraceoflavens]
MENGGIGPSENVSPWYNIPSRAVVAVEHPLIVKNFDKAIQTLGGFSEAAQMMKDQSHPVSLFLHPDDPASRPLISTNCKASNVLLKITVPKRTGRKRKRGSDEPFTADDNATTQPKDAKYLMRSLQDNANAAVMEPAGTIVVSQVFRTMPDFVYSTSNSRFMKQIREKILPFEYSLLKDFELDMSQGQVKTEILPPATLSTRQVPANYAYRQNPAVETVVDPSTGQRHTKNLQKRGRVFTIQLQYSTETIPNAPDPSAPPLTTQHQLFQNLVSTLTTIFTQRPIWTRRALLNQFDSTAPLFLVKHAVAYVAYALRSGPWRDTYVKLGTDPRTSPSYRTYQTIMLQLVPKDYGSSSAPYTDPTTTTRLRQQRQTYSRSWQPPPNKSSHIFTSNLSSGPFPRDGKAWQLCDLHDPLLSRLVHSAEPRDVCEPRYFGWYPNGSLCKIKTILKAKVDMLLNSPSSSSSSSSNPSAPPPPPIDDFIFQQFAALPDHVDPEALNNDDPRYRMPEGAEKRELEWAAGYRAMCRAQEGNGRVPTTGPGRKWKGKGRAGRNFLPVEELRREGFTERGRRRGDVEGRLESERSGSGSASASASVSQARGATVELDENEEDIEDDLGLESDDENEGEELEVEAAEEQAQMDVAEETDIAAGDETRIE